VRRSLFGHQEIAAKHRDGDKPGKIFPSQISTECEAATPRLRARGGSWEERKAKSKVKFKDTVKVKAKAKVVWNVRPHHILFPKRDERFLWE
jgi:hypothetical protein